MSLTRRHLPIGSLWSMRIDVPYSLIVRDGNLAWSCGQVPLDRDARVIHPDDMAAQARDVAGHIRAILEGVELNGEAVGKLVLYLVGDAAAAAVLETGMREAFGHTPLLVPVVVPHFYYAGLLVEVDVFAGQNVLVLEKGAGGIGAVETDDLVWAKIETGRDDGAEAVARLASMGLREDNLLADHWFLGRDAGVDPLEPLAPLVSDPGATVVQLGGGDSLLGELTFARGPVERRARTADGVRLVSRRSDGACWVTGRVEDGAGDLVGQTRRIMPAIERELIRHGLGFADVVKSTTHYAGGSSEEELHENMSVRNACYRKPGPASTGIPVQALAGPGSLIAVDVLALRG